MIVKLFFVKASHILVFVSIQEHFKQIASVAMVMAGNLRLLMPITLYITSSQAVSPHLFGEFALFLSVITLTVDCFVQFKREK